MKPCRSKPCRLSLIVAMSIVAGLLSSAPSMVNAQPALPGDRITDLRALEQRLQQGDVETAGERAVAQADALEGGNAADRWARALYLQLAAGAMTRQSLHAEAAEALSVARGIDAAPDTWRAARLHEEAALRRAAGQAERAVELLGEWLEQHAGEPGDHWRMARMLAELSRWEEAVEWVDRALENGTPNTEQQTLAATVYQRSGQGEQALAMLEADLDSSPAAEWRRAAALAQRIGEPGRAASIWEAGWRQGVLSGEQDLLQLVELHLAGGTPARAAEWLEKALESEVLADELSHRRLLAQAWQAARDRERALAAWQRVAEESGEGEDWLRLGQLAHAWNERAMAERSLQAASERGMEEAEAWLSDLRADAEAEAPPEANGPHRAQSDNSAHTGA